MGYLSLVGPLAGLVLGLRVRPPDPGRAAGWALAVLSAPVALNYTIAFAQAHGRSDWLYFPLLIGFLITMVAGIVLLRGTRWGHRTLLAAAIAWALVGIAMGVLGLPTLGSPAMALNALGPLLLCVGAAGVIRWGGLPVRVELAAEPSP